MTLRFPFAALVAFAILLASGGCGIPPHPQPPPPANVPLQGLKLDIKDKSPFYGEELYGTKDVFVYNGSDYVLDSVTVDVELSSGEKREMLADVYRAKPKTTQQLYQLFKETGLRRVEFVSASLKTAKGWDEGTYARYLAEYNQWDAKYGAAWRKQREAK